MSGNRRRNALGLAELQALFQSCVVDGGEGILAEINDTSKEGRDRLFGVYRNAYVLRLVGVLRTDYERLARHLDEADFEEMARAYVRAHPSDNPNVRWFGRHLPEFLEGTRGHKEAPELAGLARLERALGEVFDAADGTRLTLDDLAGLSADDWPGVVFSPHPATRRLDLSTNAADLWRALAGDADPEGRPRPERLAEPERLIVYRPDLVPRFRPMSYEEAMMWDEMTKGLDFAGLCEMVATYGGEEDAALRAGRHLRTWIADGMLSGPE